MINGWQAQNSKDGAHRGERYDEEDGYRNRPPSWKTGGDHDQKKRDKDEEQIITDLFTV